MNPQNAGPFVPPESAWSGLLTLALAVSWLFVLPIVGVVTVVYWLVCFAMWVF